MLTFDDLNTQKIELHTNSEDIPEIKRPSLLPSVKNSHLITSTLLVLNIFFYRNNRLAPIQILSHQELNVVAPISSLAIHKILFSFSWLAIMILILKQPRLPTQNH